MEDERHYKVEDLVAGDLEEGRLKERQRELMEEMERGLVGAGGAVWRVAPCGLLSGGVIPCPPTHTTPKCGPNAIPACGFSAFPWA